MGPFLCAVDSDLATCMVRAARGRLSGFHVACLLTQCSLSPGNFERGARGRLVCFSVVCTLVNNPRGGL